MHTWLEKYIFPREAELNSSDFYKYSCDAIDEMILFGTTCLADMYLDSAAAKKSCQEKRVRANICSQGRNLELNETDKIKIDVGLHSVYTAELDDIKNILNLGNRFHVH
ncbi:amidohydrolase family protein, partial [Treponema sp. R6D11]